MTDLKIGKIIWEIRYPAAATLFDSRGKIATEWQWKDDLSEWRISNNQVVIHNKSNTTFLNVGLGNIVFVSELPASFKHFSDFAVRFSTWTLKTLQVKKLTRIGLRIIQISEHKHFKLLVNKMKQRLIKLSDEDWDILGGSPEDIAMPLTLCLGENRVNFQIGPMKKEQLLAYFESNEAKEGLPSVVLFLDIDLYRNDPDLPIDSQEMISDFIKKGGDQVINMSKLFVERFGGFE